MAVVPVLSTVLGAGLEQLDLLVECHTPPLDIMSELKTFSAETVTICPPLCTDSSMGQFPVSMSPMTVTKSLQHFAADLLRLLQVPHF